MIKKTGILFLLCFLAASGLQAADKTSGPNLEELSKTPAAKAYISKRYEESLAEFQKMEEQYPLSALIKRYIASLYDSLGEQEKAVEKLEEALLFDPEDFVARRMLGDFQIKQMDFEQATENFQFIVDHADENQPIAQYASAKIRDIQSLSAALNTKSDKRLDAKSFMSSAPAKSFSAGRYEEALKGFEDLSLSYPEDILVKRFKGITLIRLGKTDEAIQALKEALLVEPQNAAVHYYLGLAYLNKGKGEEARKEFTWVISHDEGVYRTKAQQNMFQTLGRILAAQKKWSFTAVGGYEFDTNASYKSRDDQFSTAGDQNSGRYITNFFGNYRVYQKKRFSVFGDGFYAQTLYNDFPNFQTYTVGGGLSTLYGFTVASKPVYFNLREGVTETFLKNRYYVWTNSLAPSFTVNFSDRIRATLFYRWNYNQYAQKINTNTPEFYNRDGHGNTVGILNTVYFNSKKNFYTTVGYDYEHVETRGTEYRKNAHGVSLLLHAPLVEKIEAETVFRFKDSDYPKTFLPLQRRDDLFNITVSLTRPLTDHLALMIFYTYENTKARYNLYEYIKSVYGTQLTLRY